MPLPPQVFLRKTAPHDLPTLFRQQQDPEGNSMAGTKPHTEESFRAVWERVFADPSVEPRVIVEGGHGGELVLGGITCFQRDGLDMIGYWIDRPHWGRGIASQALALFLQEFKRRPLHATAARDNAAS